MTDRRAGLTLAELLIALAVTALALGVAIEGVRRVADFNTRLTDRREARDAIAGGLSALRVRLERSLAVSRMSDDEESEETLFEGDQNGFRFLSADPGYPSRTGVYEYRVALGEGRGPGDGTGLTLERRPLTDLHDFGVGDVGFQAWSLVSRRAEWRFGYADDEGEWQESWSIGGGMPLAVGVWTAEEGPPVMVQRLGAPRPEAPESEEEDGRGDGLHDGREPGDGGDGDGRRRGAGGNGRDPGGDFPGDVGGDDRDGAGGRG